MGRMLALVLEYDASRKRPFTGANEGVVDFTKSLDIVCGANERFLRSLSGEDGSGRPRPMRSRGFPRRMSHLVHEYFEEYFGSDQSACGCFTYAELMANLKAHSLRKEQLGEPLRRMLSIFRGLVRSYGPERVRLLFALGQY